MVSTLARASMDGAILVVAIWVLSRLVRLTPATRTILWWCAAAKFVVALAWTTPIAIPILPGPTQPSDAVGVHRVSGAAAPQVEALTRVPGRAAPLEPALVGSFVNALREWSSFAAIAWTLGLGVVAIVGLRRWRDTVRLLDASEPAPGDVQSHAIDLASRLRLRRVPQVRISPRVETPLVTGLVRPVVLVPADRFGVLTDRQQQMALCHELAHLERADLWFGCVPALAERVFFFHPLVHLASREYALAREAACDAAVMDTLNAAPQEYGRLLLALGVSHPRTGLTAAGAAWSFLNLKRRIAMLQDVSARSNRSRLVAAGAVGLALAAMVPMQLAARPGSGQAARKASVAAQVGSLDEPRPREPTEYSEPAAQVESRQPKARELSFVLLLEDGQRTMSGSSDDVQRAERHRRNGEPLLWFRYDGREYVIRDPELVRQARALWTEVYESGLGQDALRALTQTFKADELVKHAELAAAQGMLGAHLGSIVAEQSMLDARLGSIVAEQGMLGAHLGSKAEEQALHALSDARAAMAEVDQDELERHVRSMKEATREIEQKMRELEQRLKRDFDVQMRELQQRLRALEGPIREIAAPMEELGHQMEAFGQTIEKASRKANEEMRALVDRAIASGLAQTVR